ncbi:MAG TPA: (Fe-S)-binding protein [Myxococcaceae bacterium]|nr:(Fe-S)-binding protein [Myxococcaceae bacterium]
MEPVALFIPCYVDQLYPGVGLATARVLERLGVRVEFPEEQTCCGQPMANAGATEAAAPVARHHLDVFERHSHVVCPSGSCTAMVRHHYRDVLPGDPRVEAVGGRTYELCEFITDVLGIRRLHGRYPRRVGLHQSCHGLRELGLGTSSELMVEPSNKVRELVGSLEGIQLVELGRPDECCGFGGIFCIEESEVSGAMGKDRVADHVRAGAEVVTAVDMSCLMHLQGIARRGRASLEFLHVAQVLDAAMSGAGTAVSA